MYRSILVPLDRSTFAERALPLAARIAQRAGAKLHLAEVHSLYALDQPHAAWAPFDSNCDAECRANEQLYLDATAKWVGTSGGIAVATCPPAGSAVIPETIAECLLDRAKDVRADLIVMATHGLGMLNHFAAGGVAHRIVCQAGAPVILIRPGHEPTGGALPAEVLVPLDGSGLAERVLEPALDLARLGGARVTLLMVVDPRYAADSAEVGKYLDQAADRVRREGVDVRTRCEAGRDPATAIVAAAAEHPDTLIALATHGRGGLRRAVLGSVAEQVLRHTSAPVLAYHPVSGSKS